ncbi:1-deoxy-D-xylulose-5-phosphate reductoisomerase, partial [bacterium]|nr:1-deoxy-D-xylulose-5-phosphate reductoisomerase [bacterium]
EKKAGELREKLKDCEVEIFSGQEGLVRVAAHKEADIVVTAVVGAAGLLPTLEAIKRGKRIALANKETLVMAGEIVMREAEKSGSEILPVDSEHSAVFQCLQGRDPSEVKRIILTASGGPFRGQKDLNRITPKEALAHPTWKMGAKISIDSATLMNKGLEVIEACYLFGLSPAHISVLIHPQSIIHSMVEFADGSYLAQLGIADMRIPIAYALTYPHRLPNKLDELDLAKIGNLTFEEPDISRFPCLGLAYQAVEAGGTMPAVLNAANEVAVERFLKEKIDFLDIWKIVQEVMKRHKIKKGKMIEEVLAADVWAREEARKIVTLYSSEV